MLSDGKAGMCIELFPTFALSTNGNVVLTALIETLSRKAASRALRPCLEKRLRLSKAQASLALHSARALFDLLLQSHVHARTF